LYFTTRVISKEYLSPRKLSRLTTIIQPWLKAVSIPTDNPQAT
jgi:hypothetical protein